MTTRQGHPPGGSSHVAQAPRSPNPATAHSADRAASTPTVLPARLDPADSPPHSAVLGGPGRSGQPGPSAASLAAQALYPDVAPTHTHRDDIEALAAQGIFDGGHCGDNLFCPDDPMDRKTMAVWVVRILDGRDPPPGSSRFPDANNHLPAFWPPFIERMAELGVTEGCGDGTNFCPNDPVTRAQMAVFLTRAFDLPGGPDPDFSDVGQSHWASDQIAALAASGITRGCGDGSRFCPGDPTTRAQMAAFLNRAISFDQYEEDEEEHVVRVFYCGPAEGYDQQRLREEVEQFSSTISAFFREQSQGAVDLRFEAAELLSPDLEWQDQTMEAWIEQYSPRDMPCGLPGVTMRFDGGFVEYVVLSHVRVGDGAWGYGVYGLGAVVPTVEMLSERYSERGGDASAARKAHLVTVAHELGHVFWDFEHPEDDIGASDHDLGSLMSRRSALDLSEAYIACYQRRLAGWLTAGDYCDETTEDATPPDPADGQDGTLQLVISWGGDGSGRSLCPEGEECRNLAYRYIGDWPDPPYDMECKVDGRGGSRFTWSGRPHTGCIYRLYAGPSLTAQAVIYNVSTKPVRSNILTW